MSIAQTEDCTSFVYGVKANTTKYQLHMAVYQMGGMANNRDKVQIL